MYNLVLIVAEQLHQDIEIFDHHFLAVEFAGAISAVGEFLLPLPVSVAAYSGHLVADAHHHRDTPYRGISAHCSQRRLRRFCKPHRIFSL